MTSSWLAQELTTTDEIFGKPNFQKLFDLVKPKWANQMTTRLLQKEIDAYWDNAFIGSEDRTGEESAIYQAQKYFDEQLHDGKNVSSDKISYVYIDC